MSRLLRALILCLAVLPAVWGTCPGWITGRCCCASSTERASKTSKACCPLCEERDRKSGRRAPCTHCPCQMARDGSAPAPDVVEAPAADLSVSFLCLLSDAVLADAGPIVASNAASADVRPPGWPPGDASHRVGTVVLVV